MELRSSLRCGPGSPPLQTGLDSELFSPHSASAYLSVCLSGLPGALAPPGAGAYPPHYSPAPSQSYWVDVLLEMALKLFSSLDKIFIT